MKFACAGCHAQYMISDEKVLPRGVKVRCKKCNHVNIVRRPAPATDPDEIVRPAAPTKPATSLDDELGAAFDQVTGSTPGPEKTPADDFSFDPNADAAPGGLADLERTRIVEDPELQRIFAARDETPAAPAAAPAAAAPAPAPAAAQVEWYLAIDDQQIGPLSFDDVRGRWEAASIGPDTLCWRNGMADWTALSQIPELADALAPLPAPTAEDSGWLDAAMKPQEAPSPGWTPSAASALKDLVEAEMEASREAEAPSEATLERDLPAAESTSVRSLLQEVPKAPEAAAPAPEMSRLLPLSGVPEDATRAPAAPQAKPAPEAGKGGAMRWIAAVAALLLLAGGGAFAAGVFDGNLQPAPIAAAPAPAAPEPPTPAPAAPAPAEEAGAVAAAAGGAGGGGGAAVAEAAGGAAGAVAEAKAGAGGAGGKDEATETAEKIAAETEKEAQALAKAEAEKKKKVVKRKPARRKRVARRDPPPRPKPASTSSSGNLLDAAGSTDSIDSLFEQEFSGRPKAAPKPKGGGYIPPAPGSGARPRQLSQGDIAGVVVGHKTALKNCATAYKSKSGEDSGTVVMRWTIRPDGSTTGVRPVKGNEHTQLADCIGGLVKGWKFPAYSGPQMAPIDFPFQF